MTISGQDCVRTPSYLLLLRLGVLIFAIYSLNYGNLYGMKAALHLKGNEFSWFASSESSRPESPLRCWCLTLLVYSLLVGIVIDVC